MRVRTTSASLLAGAAVLLLAPLPTLAQSTAQELDAARERVSELQSRIESSEAEMERLKQRLNTLSAQVGAEQAELSTIRGDLEETEGALDETKQHLSDLRDRIRERARRVYMRGPTEIIELVLGSDTLAEFTGRLTYASRVAQRDNGIVLDIRQTEAELAEQQAAQEALAAEQRATLAEVAGQQAAVRSTFAATLAESAELAQARSEAASLVAELEDQLATELGGLRDAAGRGMTITYGQWATEFLGALGAPASRNNLVAVVAWEAAEGTQATWNPLATTMPWEGATVYNSHNVRNYPTKEDGIAATIATLERPGWGYEAIIANLRASSEPMETGRAINRSSWCAGCAGGTYVIGIIPAVEEYYDDYASR